MKAEEVVQLVRSQLDDCEVSVEGEGDRFGIRVIGQCFAGLTPVRKQQLVYACLQAPLADGSIHAVTIRTHTPDEWQKLSEN